MQRYFTFWSSDMFSNGRSFRRIGSTGLVIFERDGTLLRRNNPPRDFMLGDISNDFVRTLQQLRLIGVRFGFISDARGMDAGSHGPAEFAALTGRLDKLLEIRNAMPDFWMTWSISPQVRREILQADEAQRETEGLISAMILHAVEWYGVDEKDAIFVNSTAVGLLAANSANISSIQYSGLPADRTIRAWQKMERQYFNPSATVNAQQLNTEIQRVLGLSRQSAKCSEQG